MIKKTTFTLIALLLVFALFTPAAARSSSVAEDPAAAPFCVEGKFHPGIAKLAATFNLEYEDVVKWFCMGYDLDTIKQAIRDALANETTVEEELGLIQEDDPVCDPEAEDCDPGEGEPVCDPETEDCEPVCDPETEDCEPVCDPATEECDSEEGEDTDDPEEIDGWKESVYCTNDELRHPTAAHYAELYDMSYVKIMNWFCNGFGFGQIKHALNTAKHTEGDPQTYLDARTEGQGWGEIWKETGKPSKVHPVFGENWKDNKSQEAKPPAHAKGKPVKPGK
jgi:hypothetical protein